MNLEAQLWIADFRIAAALDSFPRVGGFLIGFFLTFSAF